jgi:hypothetical protein
MRAATSEMAPDVASAAMMTAVQQLLELSSREFGS